MAVGDGEIQTLIQAGDSQRADAIQGLLIADQPAVGSSVNEPLPRPQPADAGTVIEDVAQTCAAS